MDHLLGDSGLGRGGIDLQAGDPLRHCLGGLGGDGLDLGQRRGPRIGDPCRGLVQLGGQRLVGLGDALFGGAGGFGLGSAAASPLRPGSCPSVRDRLPPSVRMRRGPVGGLEVGGDLRVAQIDRRLDLRQHAEPDDDEDDAEEDRSQNSCEAKTSASWAICGMQTREVAAVRLLRDEEQDHGDDERQQAEKLGGGEADEQAALLAVGGRRIAQRALEERAEDVAHADRGHADADRGETGTEQLCGFASMIETPL